jgi:hypothetical protein
MEIVKEKIINQQNAIKLFQHLLNNFDHPLKIKKELEGEIKNCKEVIGNLKREKNEVFFDLKNKTISHSKKIIELKAQEFSLLEALSLSGEFHWTMGYVIFKGWHKGIKRRAFEQMGRPVTNINKLFDGVAIIESIDRGMWKVKDGTKLSTPIEKGNLILQNIKKSTPESDAINFCIKALDIYPDFPKANKMFLDILYKKRKCIPSQLSNSINSYIISSELYFQNKVLNYTNGLNIISLSGSKNDWEGYWKEALPYQWLLRKELEDNQHYLNLAKHIRENTELNEDQEKLVNLLGAIHNINSTYSKSITPPIDESDIFNNFIKETDEIRKVITWITEKYQRYSIKRTDLASKIREFLFEMFKQKKSFQKGAYKSTSQLIKDMYKSLSFRIRDWLLIERGKVPKGKVKSMWELLKAREIFENRSQRNPSYEDLLRELNKNKNKWNKEKLLEMLKYEEQLQGLQDIDEIFELTESATMKHKNQY